MANWPPPDTGLHTACVDIEAATDPWAALAAFLAGYSATSSSRRLGVVAPNPVVAPGACYNLSSQLPSGSNATISSGDWSGVGSGNDGAAWDWETCTLLVESIGMNNVTDMFLPRAWSLDWLTAHCGARFGVVPQPRLLADEWGFDEDRLASVTSRIIFTNGLNDG